MVTLQLEPGGTGSPQWKQSVNCNTAFISDFSWMGRHAQGVEPAQRDAMGGAQQAQQAKAQHQQAAGDAHRAALQLPAQARAQEAHAEQGRQGAQAEGAYE